MSSSVVPLRNATLLPSGDQAGAPAPFGREVTGHASPPCAGSTYSCGGCGCPPSSSERVKTSLRPFGDQRGLASRGPPVSRAGGSPRVETIQICVS